VEPESAPQKTELEGALHTRGAYFHVFHTNGQIGHTCVELQIPRWPRAPRSLNLSLARGEDGQDQHWISCRILAIFSEQDWIWIFIFEKKWIRIGSVCWFDFYNEIFLNVIQDVTNDGGSVFFAIFLCCAALITINGNSCYFIAIFFQPSGSSELPLYCWYAAIFVVLNGICVCRVG